MSKTFKVHLANKGRVDTVEVEAADWQGVKAFYDECSDGEIKEISEVVYRGKVSQVAHEVPIMKLKIMAEQFSDILEIRGIKPTKEASEVLESAKRNGFKVCDKTIDSAVVMVLRGNV